jgi:site-specific recombinase XerD
MYVAAMKFLYRITLNRPEEVQRIPYPKAPKTPPDVLSQDEILALLRAVQSIKYRAIIATAYATGMRISEICRLHCSGAIDSTRMLIHVRNAKGAKDRYVTLKLRERVRNQRSEDFYWNPEFEARHRSSSVNPFEYSLRNFFPFWA